ncbi:ATP-binding protein [Lusitaniella coriacea]|uniref:ATP-binding protein n=1 Tax=Lusitaniella coriacea TaxID=1983105 RepID=UPI003CF6CC18
MKKNRKFSNLLPLNWFYRSNRDGTRMRFFPISWKLLSIQALGWLFFIAAIGIFQYKNVRDELYGRIEISGKDIAQTLSIVLSQNSSLFDAKNSTSFIVDLKREITELERVLVMDPGLNIITDTDPQSLITQNDRDLLTKILEKEKEEYGFYEDYDNYKHYRIIRPIQSENSLGSTEDIIGFLLIDIDASYVEKSVYIGFMKVMTLISILLLLFAILIYHLLDRIIVSPLTRLTDASESLGQGNLATRVKINTYDELEILANSFNDMVQHLQATTVSKTYVNNIIHSMLDSMIVIDREGKIKTVNQATLQTLGYKQKELIDRHIEILFENKKLIASQVENIIENQSTIIDFTTNFLTKRNKVIPMSVSVSIMLVRGKLSGLVYVAKDITERQQAQENLRQSEAREREKSAQLEKTMQELKSMQSQLIHTEKMSSLGQMVAGVAHEINNPVSFIYGNLSPADEYIQDLLKLVEMYQKHTSQTDEEIQEYIQEIDLEFLKIDLPKLLDSMKVGANRIREIVLSLRNFSRLDEAEFKEVDLHEGIDSTLMILHNRLKFKPERPGIKVIKNYINLPLVQCYPSQLNQVFMNILANAIDALDAYNDRRTMEEIEANPSIIKIQTQRIDENRVAIHLSDNGPGMPEQVRERLFDPFFTTKPIGKGTGLGLSISYQIVVEKHGGKMWCESVPEKGAKFTIEIPIQQRTCEIS